MVSKSVFFHVIVGHFKFNVTHDFRSFLFKFFVTPFCARYFHFVRASAAVSLSLENRENHGLNVFYAEKKEEPVQTVECVEFSLPNEYKKKDWCVKSIFFHSDREFRNSLFSLRSRSHSAVEWFLFFFLLLYLKPEQF